MVEIVISPRPEQWQYQRLYLGRKRKILQDTAPIQRTTSTFDLLRGGLVSIWMSRITCYYMESNQPWKQIYTDNKNK